MAWRWRRLPNWPGRPPNPEGSGPDLPAAAHHVLVAGELLHAHRTTRVKPVGGNADLRAHAKFAAIGELRGRVVQHDGAVDAFQEYLRRRRVGGDDAFGVRRTVLADV